MATEENPVAFKDTKIGRAIRTFNQVFIVAAPTFLAMIVLPDVQNFIQANATWLVALLPPLIAVVTYYYNVIQNKVTSTIKQGE